MGTTIFVEVALIILVYMLIWFALAQIMRNNSIVDIAWGLGFVVVSTYVELFHKETPNLILLGIVTIWGIRLALYIFIRGIKKGEDWRYQALKKGWSSPIWLHALTKVFLFQGFLLLLIAIPLQVSSSESSFQFLPGVYLGLGMWLLGFLWESIADTQLYLFKRNPVNQGKIMQSGLWAYSRHPNYFGEIILWWGIFIYGVSIGFPFYTILSPILITWLLMRVSGVPFLESKYKDNPTYRAYVKKTNSLFPQLFKTK